MACFQTHAQRQQSLGRRPVGAMHRKAPAARTAGLAHRVTMGGKPQYVIVPECLRLADPQACAGIHIKEFRMPAEGKALLNRIGDHDDMAKRACKFSNREGFSKEGERIVIVAGVPFGTPGATNMVRIAFTGNER